MEGYRFGLLEHPEASLHLAFNSSGAGLCSPLFPLKFPHSLCNYAD